MVEEKIIQAEKYAFIEYIWVIQPLFIFTTLCLEKKCRFWVKAINALIALCCLQEAKHSHHSKPSALDIKLEQNRKPLSIFDLPGFLDFILIKYEVTQYIFGLNKEELPAVTYLNFFHNCGNLKKHFYCKHL